MIDSSTHRMICVDHIFPQIFYSKINFLDSSFFTVTHTPVTHFFLSLFSNSDHAIGVGLIAFSIEMTNKAKGKGKEVAEKGSAGKRKGAFDDDKTGGGRKRNKRGVLQFFLTMN